MKTTLKRTISIVLTALILLCAVPFCASAEESPAKDNLSVTVFTSRPSYSLRSLVEVMVKVKNTGDSLITDVNSGAYISGFAVVAIDDPFAAMGAIGPGETKSFSFYAVPTLKTPGFNFFEKIVLFFSNLFIKTREFPMTGIQDKYKSTGNCKFLFANKEFSVSAYATAGEEYYPAEDVSKEEIIDMYNKALRSANDKDFSSKSESEIVSVSVADEKISPLTDAVFNTLSGNSISSTSYYNELLSFGEVEYDDIESAILYKTGNGSCIRLSVKPQTFTMGSDNDGPVSRALGDFNPEDTVDALSYEIISGSETMKYDLTSVVVGCTLDENGSATEFTGKDSLEFSCGTIVMKLFRTEVTIEDGFIVSTADYYVSTKK